MVPDFARVDAPMFSPTRCAACSTHKCEEGFVDLICKTATAGFVDGAPVEPAADEPTYGRLYLCARCVWVAARLVGCLDPQQAASQTAWLMEVEGRVLELTAALEAEKAKPQMLDPDATLAYIEAHRPGPKPKVATSS